MHHDPRDTHATADLHQLRAVLDQLATAILTKDAAGRYTYVNDRACLLMGRSRDEMLGRTADELFGAAAAAGVCHEEGQVLATGETRVREQTLQMPGGPRHFLLQRQALRDAAGQVVGLSITFTDITARKRQEEQIVALKNRMAAALQALPDLLFELDIDGRCHDCHAPRRDLLIVPPQEQIGRNVHEVLPASAAAVCMQALRDAHVHGHAAGHQFVLPLPTGPRWFELSVARKPGPADQVPRFIALSRDITDRRRAEENLREQQSLLRAIVDHTPVQYWARDLEGRCVMENAQVVAHWGSLLGKRLEDTDARPVDLALWKENNDLAYAGQVVDREVEYVVDGQCRTFQNVVAPVHMDGRIVGIVGFNQDITERKAAADQIRQLAFYDSLTGLPNRRLMLDRLARAVAGSVRHRRAGALLLIDLDHFKELNDTRGHDAGDQLLVEVAARLRAGIRASDTAARMGGDEFVVIFEEVDGELDPAMQAEHLAAQLQQRLSQPCVLQMGGPHRTLSHHFTCSIGIATFKGSEVSPEELMRRADTALYQAKGAGRNTLRFHDPRLQSQVDARAALATDLRAAIERDQFLLHFQPQVDGAGRIVGAEVLLRWRHPERGPVSPAEFIPLAEETGLIAPIGRWVLELACRQLALWRADPLTAALSLAVNVSAQQFRQPSFVGQLQALMSRVQTPPSRLKLELTESMLLDHAEDVIGRMQRLKDLGVGFALDDFGTGYSSLAYLKRLPLDQLKIDQSFVRDVLTDANDAAIARTIVALGNTLGLAVIAEGVETTEQRRFLAENGCHAYQGYLFGRPLPLADFEALLRCQAGLPH